MSKSPATWRTRAVEVGPMVVKKGAAEAREGPEGEDVGWSRRWGGFRGGVGGL